MPGSHTPRPIPSEIRWRLAGPERPGVRRGTRCPNVSGPGERLDQPTYVTRKTAPPGRPVHKPGRQCLAATANAGRVPTLSPVDAPGHRTLLLPTQVVHDGRAEARPPQAGYGRLSRDRRVQDPGLSAFFRQAPRLVVNVPLSTAV